MSLQRGLTAIDKCVENAWLCRANLELSLSPRLKAEIGMEYACENIKEICQLWADLSHISKGFLDAVARDNASRFHVQSLPVFKDNRYESWHHYAIETIRNGVHMFMAEADSNIVFREKDLSKLRLIATCLDHLTDMQIESMRDNFPTDYSTCRTGMLCERNNCSSKVSGASGRQSQSYGGRQSCKLTPEVKRRILSIGRAILGFDKGIQKQKFWKEIKRELDKKVTDGPGIQTISRNFIYDKAKGTLKQKNISCKH